MQDGLGRNQNGTDIAAQQQARTDDGWKAGWLQVAGMWADYPELDDILAKRRAARKRRRERMMREMAK